MSRHRRAYEAMIAKHWDGDEAAYLEWFTHVGRIASDPVPQNSAWQRWEPVTRLPPYAQEVLDRYRRKHQKGD